jgi:hypothetical protein
MANPTYLSKTLITASSTIVGTLSSASPGVAVLNTASLDTQRRIIIWSASGTLATASFTITGTREGGSGSAKGVPASGTTVTETITGPASGTTVSTTQDFLSVTSVSASSVIATMATFGTNTLGGTPWQSVNLHVTPVQIGGAITFSSSANSMVAQVDYTMDSPFTFGTPAPGGLPALINAVPIVFTSTTVFSSAVSNVSGPINFIGTATTPIVAWRMTLTSSSSSAGNVNISAVQAGIG